MEKHTRGLNGIRTFYKSIKDNTPYELVAVTEDSDFILRNLLNGLVNRYWEGSVRSDFIEITQAEVFDCIDNNDDKQHADMMEMLGIGYICPFCGGRLRWESDFMSSEVHGNSCNYIEIKNLEILNRIKEDETQYIKSRLLGVTDNIDKENNEIVSNDYYEYLYMREDRDGKSTYYLIDDSVIGIYTCSNCGKRYEIQDCLPSDEKDYPYFSK